MVACGSPLPRISLRVGQEVLPAVVLELSGQRAFVRSERALLIASSVRLHIDWGSGLTTSLPGRVSSVVSITGSQHVSQVELSAVEGDWTSFLAFLGPTALAS